MDINRLPFIDDHQSQRKYLGNGVKNIISENKFILIQKFLNLSDYSKNDETKLYKIQIIFKIIDSWKYYFYPKKELTLDKTIMPFYVRTKFSLYSLMKPHKWGFNPFTLCLNFILYTGTEFTEQMKIKYDINFKPAIEIDLCLNYFNFLIINMNYK